MKAFISILMLWISVGALADKDVKKIDANSLTALELKSISGKVKITKSEDAFVSIEANKIVFPKACSYKVEVAGDELKIVVANAKDEDCKVNFLVRSPESLDVDVAIGKGDLEIAGPKADIEYKIGKGNVKINTNAKDLEGKIGIGDLELNGSFHELDLRFGKGNLNMKGFAEESELKFGTGKVDLVFSKSPQDGELDIRMGAGNANLVFPEGTSLQTVFRAASGNLTNEFSESQDANFKISFKAGAGNLVIKRY